MRNIALTLSYEGKELGTVDLIAVNDVELSETLYRLERIKAFFGMPTVRIGIALVAVALAILLLRLTLFRPRNRYGSRGSGRHGGYTGRRR